MENETTILKTIEGTAPLFDGFYNSIYDSLDEDECNSLITQSAEDLAETRPDLTDDQINEVGAKIQDVFYSSVDYVNLHNKIAKNYVYNLEYELKERGFDLKVSYQSVDSPREYNFRTDKILVKYTVSSQGFENVIKYVENNKTAFERYIKDNFTSCSGYISFLSNDIRDWTEEYIEDWFSEVLAFILLNENDEIEHSLNMQTLEDSYDAVYTATDYTKIHDAVNELVATFNK